MIRLDAIQDDDRMLIAVSIDGRLVLSTPDDEQAIERLKALGVSDPGRFIAGCRQWGAVEIHEPAMREPQEDAR